MTTSLSTLTWILLGAWTLITLLENLADALNLRSLSPAVPPEFSGLIDPGKYSELLRYQADNIRFALLRRWVELIALAAFLLLGGFEAVDRLARGLTESPILRGLIFFGALGLLRSLLSLPFSVYHTFVIEERYGFNRTTAATFVGDLLKGLLLSVVLGAPIAALVLFFFERAGSHAWLWAWLAVMLIQIAILFIAPVWIMPLFNKYEPLPEGDLKAAIEALARERKFSLQGIYWMDSSKRSSKSNAFFTGFGRYKRLVLFDTLIERQSVSELVAIVAHEIGHYELKHIQRTIAISFLFTAAIFWAMGGVLGNPLLFEAFRMSTPSVYASLVLFSLALSPALRVWGIWTHALSRKHEFEADHFARRVVGRPEDLVEALKKLARDNLSHLTPHPLKVALDYTHPPLLRRIEALRRG